MRAVRRVEILAPAGWPSSQPTLHLVHEVAARLAPHAEVALALAPLPALRVEGQAVGLDERGAPPRWLVEALIVRGLAPLGVLFLCVANSCRSQLAEALGRVRAAPGVEVRSAGSAPGRLSPLAVAVLAELGIDATAQRAKGLQEIDPRRVEVAVTLCQEESCPAWLAPSVRLHWPLPDPAAATGDEAERRRAFRAVRDELGRRLDVLFGEPRAQRT